MQHELPKGTTRKILATDFSEIEEILVSRAYTMETSEERKRARAACEEIGVIEEQAVKRVSVAN